MNGYLLRGMNFVAQPVKPVGVNTCKHQNPQAEQAAEKLKTLSF